MIHATTGPWSKLVTGGSFGVTWDPYETATRLHVSSFDHGSYAFLKSDSGAHLDSNE